MCRGETPTLYTVIPEKTAAVGGAMMGSSHVYELGTAVAAATAAATTTKKVSESRHQMESSFSELEIRLCCF